MILGGPYLEGGEIPHVSPMGFTPLVECKRFPFAVFENIMISLYIFYSP